MINCTHILKLPELKKAKIVAGENGLNRIVRWAHVVELQNVGEWMESGELIFLTGVGLKNYEEDLTNIIKDIDRKNAAGLFVEVGPFIEHVPKEVLKIADELSIPIFEIPFEVKIIDITQSICKMIFNNMAKEKSMNELMKEILYEKFSDELEERAEFYGYDSEKIYKALVIGIDRIKEYTENEIIEIKAEIENASKHICGKHNRTMLYFMKNNYFIMLITLSNNINREIEIRVIADEIREFLRKRKNGVTVNIGIGNNCTGLKEFKRSVCEAQKSLKILKACKRIDNTREYKELGVYRLLFKIDDIYELKNICLEILGLLMEQDEKNGTDFLKTLEVYLKEDRNLGKTAEELYIHRNTMKYRIARIQEILQCNLDDANTCFNISLAYKIKRFINL